MEIVASFDARTKGFTSEGRVYRRGSDGSVSQESIKATFLWDTGASDSTVSQKLYDTLHLWTLREGSYAAGIGGAVPSTDCAALIAIRNADATDVWIKTALFGTFPTENAPGIDVILGLDIILKGRLVIEKKDGIPILTFTIESP